MMTKNDIQPGKGEEIIETEKSVSPRTQSRRVALQALYQWQMNNDSVPDIIQQFEAEERLKKLDFDWFKELFTQVVAEHAELDALLINHLQRAIARIDPVERAIMRIGAYELLHKVQIPYKVVINESVELAKQFGAEDSHKFINGVLDKVAHEHRPLEFAQ